MKNRLLEILGSGLSLILPEICQACRSAAADRPFPVCPRCKREIFSSPSCPKASSDLIPEIWSCREYGGALGRCIRAFKYNGSKRLSPLFADLAASFLIENHIAPGSFDVIVPVPIHRSKFRVRGYNQAELIACMLSGSVGTPVDKRTLLKIRDTRPQMGLDRGMRLKNLEGSFATVDRIGLTGKSVLLCDDVMTTGATLEVCAEELLRAGAAEVKAFTLARVL